MNSDKQFEVSFKLGKLINRMASLKYLIIQFIFCKDIAYYILTVIALTLIAMSFYPAEIPHKVARYNLDSYFR